MANTATSLVRARPKAVPPVPRPDRKFYAATSAFGRFGMRWFDPQIMAAEHYHGHIELNWLTSGSMDYLLDGKPLHIPGERLVMFWAGIPHKTIGIDRGPANDSRQCNVYLPLDTFLHMPRLGRLPETMMAGGVIALSSDTSAPRRCAAGTRIIAAAMPSAPTSSRPRSPSCCAAPR